MGPARSKELSESVYVSHPYFTGAEVITHDHQLYIKIKMLVDSQRTIKQWEESQKTLEKIDT